MAEKHQKRKTAQPDQPPEAVKLKPILGIQPGYYVVALLAAAILLLLFLLLLYPGLKSDLRSIHVDSTPPGAAVYHDGVRLGATPGTFDLPAGTTEITLRRPGFRDATIETDIPRRSFATLPFPPQVSENVRMQPEEGATEYVLNTAGNELARWAAVGESTATRPLPPILTHAAYDLNAIADSNRSGGNTDDHRDSAGSDSPDDEEADDDDPTSQFLLSSAQNITSAAMLRDLVYASWIQEGETRGNAAPGALAAGEMVQNIIHLHKNSEGFLAWLESLEGTGLHTALRDSEPLEQEQSDNRALESTYRSDILGNDIDDSSETQSGLTLAGVDFVRVPAGEVLLGFSEGLTEDDPEATRMLHDTDEFHISRTPVTVETWQEFLNDRPQWSADRGDELVGEGLADEGYLRQLESQAEDEPVTHVSWYAASAFAEWASEKAGSDFTVSLPSEAQWARAALLNSFNTDVSGRAFGYASGVRSVTGEDSRSGRLGIIDLLGNVWEWTRSPYYMADTRLRVTDSTLASAGRSGYAVVRGGSWANDSQQIGFETRGGQPKHWATPFLGFRLVAEEGAQ